MRPQAVAQAKKMLILIMCVLSWQQTQIVLLLYPYSIQSTSCQPSDHRLASHLADALILYGISLSVIPRREGSKGVYRDQISHKLVVHLVGLRDLEDESGSALK